MRCWDHMSSICKLYLRYSDMPITQIGKDRIQRPKGRDVGGLIVGNVKNEVGYSIPNIHFSLSFSGNGVSKFRLIRHRFAVLRINGDVVKGTSRAIFEEKEMLALDLCIVFTQKKHLLKLPKDPVKVIQVVQRVVDVHGERRSAALNKRRSQVEVVTGSHHHNTASSEICLTILEGLSSTFSVRRSNLPAGQRVLHRRGRWCPQEGQEECGDKFHR